MDKDAALAPLKVALKAIVNLQHLLPCADVSEDERELNYMMLAQNIDALKTVLESAK